jgi:hypothetical protein
MPAELHSYELMGLAVAAEPPLPELTRRTDERAPDLTIRMRPIPAPPPSQNPLSVAGDEASLNAAPARFRVRAGREIDIEPKPGASAADVRDFLLGPVLGIVCHQRGLLPLHASAVVLAGRAVAFAGPSGAGKSTLAAQLGARGHAVVCDDLCALDLAAGAVRVLPGVPRLKLWPDALERLGGALAASAIGGGADKRQAPMPAFAAGAPLGGVCILAGRDDGGRFAIEPLTGAAAVEALMANVFRAQYLAPMRRLPQAFAAAAALAARAPVFALARSGDLRDLEADTAELERRFARATAPA